MTPKASHPDQYDPAEDDDEQEPTPTPTDDNGGDNEAQVRSKEAAKYRLRAKAAEEKVAKLEARLAELEGGSAGKADDDKGSDDSTDLEEENRELRIGNAFLEEAAGRFTDLGAAYKLLDRALISFTGNNEVTGMPNAVSHVAERYPFLVVEGKEVREEKTKPDAGGPSGSPFNGPRKANEGLDMAALAKKFPSLQKRLRG